MLSKKMAVSLTSLITMLALAFVAPTAMGGVLGADFKTMITFDTGVDKTVLLGENVVQSGDSVFLKVIFQKTVEADEDDDGTNAKVFGIGDIKVFAYNKRNNAVIGATVKTLISMPNPGTEFIVEITGLTPDNADNPIAVVVTIGAGKVTNADPADVVKTNTGDDTLGTNAKGSLTFDVVAAPATGTPKVVEIKDLPPIVLGPGADDVFSFTVVLSEKAKELKKDHIDIANATIDSDPVYAGAIAPAGGEGSEPLAATGPDGMHHRYIVTVKPKYESKDDIVIKIKSFEEASSAEAEGGGTLALKKSVLSMPYMVKVNSDANKKVGLSGTEKNLPTDVVVPANGYLVVAKTGDSQVRGPGDAKHGSADIARRASAKDQTYNLTTLDLGINLEGFLIRGGTIDLVSPNAGLMISEIMWATDAGDAKRQWIEIHNTTAADIKFGDKTHKVMLYEANEVLPDMADAANNIVDRVSTLYKGTNIWSIAGIGQSGRTVGKIVEETDAAVDIEIVPTDRLISMERAMDTAGMYANGTMQGSWGTSMPPSQNFVDAAGGLFVGSPGTSAINPVADVVVTPDPEPTPVAVAMGDDIKITEIMVDTDSGRLPQWIELTSVAMGEVSLEGWEMVIDNAIDADVLGGGNAITVSLSGVTLDVSAHEGNLGQGQSALVVAWSAQRSSDNIRADRVVDVGAQLGQTRRYQLLSYNGFRITLVPPQTGAIADFGDIAGNLHEEWELPMDGRSSIIRREMDAAGMAMMGTDANGWVLASATPLITGQPSYYGDDEDQGTPGQDAGGPLPVELSHFRPARDKATGAVVITWATQSELNNAGFFIKRSQQRNGEFKVINATMVPGAGTTSEKQFYTYTDTTAQPNIVYYYQIEDVSLDGNRQTLTRGIRLKGHIGAAGKLTSTWGEIKASNE